MHWRKKCKAQNSLNALVELNLACNPRLGQKSCPSPSRCTIYPIQGYSLSIRPGILVNGRDLTSLYAYSGVIRPQTTCNCLYCHQYKLMVVVSVGASKTDLWREWMLVPIALLRRPDGFSSQAVCQVYKLDGLLFLWSRRDPNIAGLVFLSLRLSPGLNNSYTAKARPNHLFLWTGVGVSGHR